MPLHGKSGCIGSSFAVDPRQHREHVMDDRGHQYRRETVWQTQNGSMLCG